METFLAIFGAATLIILAAYMLYRGANLIIIMIKDHELIRDLRKEFGEHKSWHVDVHDLQSLVKRIEKLERLAKDNASPPV